MQKNVANFERFASVIIGGLALQQTLSSSRSLPVRTATGSLGAAMLFRGLTGKCPIYKSLDIDRSSGGAMGKSLAPGFLERSALVNLSVDDVTNFLSTEETPWGRFSGSDKEFQINRGSRLWLLTLSEHADGKRCLIKMSWNENGQADDAGEESMSTFDLRKLKSLLETGEIASIEGQAHGRRSSLGTFFENFGDKVLHSIQSRTELGDPGESAGEASDAQEQPRKREARA